MTVPMVPDGPDPSGSIDSASIEQSSGGPARARWRRPRRPSPSAGRTCVGRSPRSPSLFDRRADLASPYLDDRFLTRMSAFQRFGWEVLSTGRRAVASCYQLLPSPTPLCSSNTELFFLAFFSFSASLSRRTFLASWRAHSGHLSCVCVCVCVRVRVCDLACCPGVAALREALKQKYKAM